MSEHTILDDSYASNDSGLSTEAKFYLKETAKWGKFMAIVGFVFLGFIVLMFIIMLVGGASALIGATGLDEFGIGGMGIGLGIGMLIYISFIICMMLFPSLFLYNFSTKTQAALESNDATQLTEAFKNLKSLYKFWGVLTAIIVGFYALAFLVTIFGIGSVL